MLIEHGTFPEDFIKVNAARIGTTDLNVKGPTQQVNGQEQHRGSRGVAVSDVRE